MTMYVAIEPDSGLVFGPFITFDEAVEYGAKRWPADPSIDPKMTRSHGSTDLRDIADELADIYQISPLTAATEDNLEEGKDE
jgi:hypothetical protein